MINRGTKTTMGLLGFMAFLGIGAFLGLMLAPKEGKENRRYLVKTLNKFKRNIELNKGELKAHVWEVFGEVNDDLEKGYMEAREHVSAIADILRRETDLTKEKYDAVVENTVKRVGKAHDWTKRSTRNLINDLQDEWEILK
jgi:gas vesicle protein